MRIKKTSQTTPTGASVVNVQSNSTQDAYACNYVNNAIETAVQDVYSTDEVKTNKVWIDGKPIYRKVINTGSVYSNKEVDANISNSDTIVNLYGGGTLAGTSYFVPWNFYNTGGFIGLYYQPANDKLIIERDNYSYASSYVAIEYTKATD